MTYFDDEGMFYDARIIKVIAFKIILAITPVIQTLKLNPLTLRSNYEQGLEFVI